MSERFAERLSRFTPDGSGLDRDALLFAAGRASVHSGRLWATLAATLAATQILTLALLWPRPSPPVNAPVVETAPSPVVPSLRREPVLPPASELPPLWTLGQHLLEPEAMLPPPRPIENLAPDPPVLRIFSMTLDGFTH